MRESKLETLFRESEKTGGGFSSHANFWLKTRRLTNYIGLDEASHQIWPWHLHTWKLVFSRGCFFHTLKGLRLRIRKVGLQVWQVFTDA